MWNNDFDPKGSGRPPAPEDKSEKRPIQQLMWLGFIFAFAFFVASFMPPALVAPVLRELLFYAALGAILSASLKRQPLLAGRGFTGWDQAAVLALVSLLCGLFVDPQAVQETLAQLQASGTGAAS